MEITAETAELITNALNLSLDVFLAGLGLYGVFFVWRTLKRAIEIMY